MIIQLASEDAFGRADLLVGQDPAGLGRCRLGHGQYQRIGRKIEHFHAMNIFKDGDTAAQLGELKAQIFGLTGETLKEQPDLAEKLSQACATLKQELPDPSAVSSLTGRLKRRVVLD